MQYRSNSEQDTKKISQKIAASLQGGDIVLLYGELGAGKSAFTRGVAEYFNINKNVTSPTFTLMNVYPTEHPTIKRLVHVDTYRLEDEQQLIEIGAEDYLGAPDTVCFVEWPEKLLILLENKKTISIKIVSQGKNQRQIIVSE
jgi:tRNA threonylcarbamoyladenosine biosynthesis protein TsaE